MFRLRNGISSQVPAVTNRRFSEGVDQIRVVIEASIALNVREKTDWVYSLLHEIIAMDNR